MTFIKKLSEPETLLCAYPDSHAFRQDVNLFSEKRADLSGAPVYEYLLTYESAYNGGTISWHGVELPFVFHNAEDKGCVL